MLTGTPHDSLGHNPVRRKKLTLIPRFNILPAKSREVESVVHVSFDLDVGFHTLEESSSHRSVVVICDG